MAPELCPAVGSRWSKMRVAAGEVVRVVGQVAVVPLDQVAGGRADDSEPPDRQVLSNRRPFRSPGAHLLFTPDVGRPTERGDGEAWPST